MTDERLRAAERRFRASGQVEDEAAWLAEQVRAGALPADRLELAAYCGYPAARLAAPPPPPGPAWGPLPSQEAAAFAAGLERWGWEPPLRALLVALRALLDHPDAPAPGDVADADGEPPITRAAFAALEAWLDCPCPRHAARAAAAGDLPAQAVGCQGDPKTAAAMAARLVFLSAAVLEDAPALLASMRAALIPWALDRA